MFFILLLFFSLLFDVILHPSVDYRRGFYTPFYTFSPAHRRVIRDTFIFDYSILPRALRPWVGIFYPQAFFTLCSFTHIVTCVCQGFPGSRQFFFEVCRTSYWSSKHRPGPSVCLIHSNPQSFIHLKFVFIHVNIAKVLLVVKTLIKNIDQQPHYSAAMKI